MKQFLIKATYYVSEKPNTEYFLVAAVDYQDATTKVGKLFGAVSKVTFIDMTID